MKLISEPQGSRKLLLLPPPNLTPFLIRSRSSSESSAPTPIKLGVFYKFYRWISDHYCQSELSLILIAAVFAGFSRENRFVCCNKDELSLIAVRFSRILSRKSLIRIKRTQKCRRVLCLEVNKHLVVNSYHIVLTPLLLF